MSTRDRLSLITFAIVLLTAWATAVSAQEGPEGPIPVPVWADTNSVFHEVEGIQPDEWTEADRETWEEMKACVGNDTPWILNGIRVYTFEKITVMVPADLLEGRDEPALAYVAGMWTSTAYPAVEPAILLHEHARETDTVDHEMIHALCPECRHGDETFRKCVPANPS